MRKLNIILLTLFMLICIGKVYAIDNETKIYDYAQVLPDTEEEKLNDFAKQFTLKNNIDIIIVTARHSKDVDTTKYAEEFYKTYKFGLGNDSSGLILVLDFNGDNTNLEIATFGKAKNIYEKSLDNILEELRSDSSEDYYNNFKKFIDLSDDYMNGKKVNSTVNKLALNGKWIYILCISFFVPTIVILYLFIISNKKPPIKEEYTYVKENSLDINAKSDKFVTTHTESSRVNEKNNK